VVLVALLVWAVSTPPTSRRGHPNPGNPPRRPPVFDVHDEDDVEHELYGAECQTTQDNPVVTGRPRPSARRSRRSRDDNRTRPQPVPDDDANQRGPYLGDAHDPIPQARPFDDARRRLYRCRVR